MYLGSVKLRTNLDVHLKIHRPLLGDLDRLDIEPRLCDRFELVVLVDLLERRHQEVRLDLVGNLLLEPLDDQLPRSAARAKAGDDRLLAEVLQRLFVLAIDFVARNRDLQVLLARADIGDVDPDLELALRALRDVSTLARQTRRSPKQTPRIQVHRCSSKAFPRV